MLHALQIRCTRLLLPLLRSYLQGTYRPSHNKNGILQSIPLSGYSLAHNPRCHYIHSHTSQKDQPYLPPIKRCLATLTGFKARYTNCTVGSLITGSVSSSEILLIIFRNRSTNFSSMVNRSHVPKQLHFSGPIFNLTTFGFLIQK